MKKLVISTLLVMQVFWVFGQTASKITGRVLDSKTKNAIQNVEVSLQNTHLTELTNPNGEFELSNVTFGIQIIKISSQGYVEQQIQITVENGKTTSVGDVFLKEDVTTEQQNSLITITEGALNDEVNGSESTASLLQSSRDAFLQVAAFNLGQARFSVRGIDNEYSSVMINGILMNKMADGRPQYGDWGGLNDVTRNQEFTNGSAPSDYIFGGIAGTQEINTRASLYRKGSRISFLNTNTNYSFRAMATTSSGMQTDGWAYTLSAGRRWAENGYFDGTNYSANSLFASVEKRINNKHSLNFTSILAQNKRGKNSPNTQETLDLMGDKYNSYWGFQEGERRNSRYKKSEEPMVMLTHYWTVNDKTRINTSLAFQTGQIGNSRLDYTKVDNPDPTYYRKLPSYYTNYFNNDVFVGNTPFYVNAAAVTRANFLANPQLDWKNIYKINQENLANGSRIVLYEDRNDENIVTFNTNLASQLTDHIFVNAGLNYQNSITKNFKKMVDLLGGNYFTDVATFGLYGDQNQSDLNNPNRIIGKNDQYGYNYNIEASRFDFFTQFKFVFKKIDFYLAQSFSKSAYQREGLYKNGYYPDNSFGKSETIDFENFGFKGGFTYKISGKHYVDFNGIYMSKAPNTKDVFANARVNNFITENIENEKINGGDLSYIIKTPKFKSRISAYYIETKNSTDINFYYADGVSVGTSSGAFVSEIVTGINKRNKGLEVGLEYQLSATVKFTGVAALGNYTITNNPDVKLSNDLAANVVSYGAANLAGYKLSGSPQQAFSFGAEYRDPKFWWIGTNINYLAESYVDVSTIKRTNSYFTSPDNAGITIDPAKADTYLKQEKLNPFYLLNVVGGKSWRIQGKTFGLFANINNLLNVAYKTGGFEQSRNATYKQDDQDHYSGGNLVFGPKYFNGYGRTYMINIYLNF